MQWLPAEASGDVLRIDAEFRPGSAGKVGLVLRAGEADGLQERTVLAYSALSGLRCPACPASSAWTGRPPGTSGSMPTSRPWSACRFPWTTAGCGSRIFLDRCSVEVFAQDGLVTLTDQIFPAESSTAVGLLAEGDGATLVSLSITG